MHYLILGLYAVFICFYEFIYKSKMNPFLVIIVIHIINASQPRRSCINSFFPHVSLCVIQDIRQAV